MLRVNLIRDRGVRMAYPRGHEVVFVIPGNGSRGMTRLTVHWSTSTWYSTRKVKDVVFCRDN